MEGKQKYLLCTDNVGYDVLEPIVKHLVKRDIVFERINIENGDISIDNIPNWLSNQKMGSFLYFAGSWDKLPVVKRFAESAGLSEEEYQLIGVGEKVQRIFCCRCHAIHSIFAKFEEVVCASCGLLLSVSNHYSRLHDAYLGYVAKL